MNTPLSQPKNKMCVRSVLCGMQCNACPDDMTIPCDCQCSTTVLVEASSSLCLVFDNHSSAHSNHVHYYSDLSASVGRQHIRWIGQASLNTTSITLLCFVTAWFVSHTFVDLQLVCHTYHAASTCAVLKLQVGEM